MSVVDLVQRINASDTRKAVIYTAGGGSEVFPLLLGRGGGSATLLAGRIPYGDNDFRETLGYQPGRAVDAETARGLAMAAFRHALRVRDTPSAATVLGIGATAKLSKGTGERPGRTHEIHVALHSTRATLLRSLVLTEGADRAWEERICALLILNVLAWGKGIDAEVSLQHDGRTIPPAAVLHFLATAESCRHPGLPALLLGQRPWIAYDLWGDGRLDAAEGAAHPVLLLPGSFRPLHEGHVAMCAAAERLTGLTCAYEISIANPDKPTLDYLAISERLRSFSNEPGRLYLTNAPTYVEKARLFPNCTFVCGHDTAQRIIDPKYYGGERARDAALRDLETLGARFLIFGRVDAHGRFRDLSAEEFQHPTVASFLGKHATPVPEQDFRIDISSTEIRRQQARGAPS